jgi:hypothetical protein
MGIANGGYGAGGGVPAAKAERPLSVPKAVGQDLRMMATQSAGGARRQVFRLASSQIRG